MLRTQPPRGRAASLVLYAAVILSLLAVPASAAGDVALSAPERVTGDQLVLTPEGLAEPVALVVELTDADGAVGMWRYPAAVVDDDEALSVDLSAPHDGTAPRNGRAAIRVSSGAGRLASASTVIDRTPPVPALRSVVRGQRVGLTWDPVGAAGAVTYRLERILTGGSWTVVQEGQSADGYTDRDLAPGRYRYRLSAALPAADEGLNWSAPSAVQVKIAAPRPTASPTPTKAEPTAEPAADDARADAPADAAAPKPKPQPKAESESTRQRPRRHVAASGQVRGPVTGDARPAQMRARPTPLLSTADEPAVNGAEPARTTDQPAVAAPEVAPPAAPTPQVAAPEAAPRAIEPFPVTVPPAGALAVQTATQTPPDPVTLLTGFAFLLLAGGVGWRARTRPGLRVIQDWLDAR